MAENQNRTLQDKFMLRFPDGMRDALKAAAARNKRSLNAEIISRLEQSFIDLVVARHADMDTDLFAEKLGEMVAMFVNGSQQDRRSLLQRLAAVSPNEPKQLMEDDKDGQPPSEEEPKPLLSKKREIEI